MKLECKDLEKVLREQRAEEIAALEEHARECAACRAEMEAWAEISAAAQTMKREWSSPHLWPQIEERLEAEARAEAERKSRWSFGWLWQGFVGHWQLAAATVALLAVTLTGTLILTRYPRGPEPPKDDALIINEKVFKEVETAEAGYAQSIEHLSKLAEAKLQKADTPILANYREKLLVLDSAIAECRRQIERNKYNAHLRSELMFIYQEKKKTLEAVLQED